MDDKLNVCNLDLTKFIEHLRSIHFVLLGTCFIIIAAIYLSEDPVAIKALNQLRSIRDSLPKSQITTGKDIDSIGKDIRESLKNDLPWPHLIKYELSRKLNFDFNLFSSGMKALKIIFEIDSYTSEPVNKDLPLKKGIKILFIINSKQKIFIPAPQSGSYDCGSALDFVDYNRLSGLIRIWDESDNIFVLPIDRTMFDKSCILFLNMINKSGNFNTQIKLKPIQISSSNNFIINPGLSGIEFPILSLDPCVEKGGKFKFISSFSRRQQEFNDFRIGDAILRLPNGFDFAERYSCRSLILEKFRNRPPDLAFSKAFPELTGLSKFLTNLTLNDLESVIESEIERSKEALELFGAKLPVTEIAFWGGLFIIIQQFYFLVHLKEFSKRIQPSASIKQIAWIGLYTSWQSKGATILSVIIIPVFTTIYSLIRLFMQSGLNTYTIMFHIILVIISFIISILTSMMFKSVWLEVNKGGAVVKP